MHSIVSPRYRAMASAGSLELVGESVPDSESLHVVMRAKLVGRGPQKGDTSTSGCMRFRWLS